MSVTIYHNSRCSKSRQTLTLLEQHAPQPVVVFDYLTEPLDIKRLCGVQQQLGLPSVRDMMRTGESAYTELNLSGATENELLDAIIKHPILLQRPIVVKGDKAVIGRPPENVMSLLD